jgi:hypothetical protein
VWAAQNKQLALNLLSGISDFFLLLTQSVQQIQFTLNLFFHKYIVVLFQLHFENFRLALRQGIERVYFHVLCHTTKGERARTAIRKETTDFPLHSS